MIIANGGCYRDPIRGATHFTATKCNDSAFKLAGTYLFDQVKASDGVPKSLMPVLLSSRQEAKQKAIQLYIQNSKESCIELLYSVSRCMNTLNNHIGGLMNEYDHVSEAKSLCQYKLEKLHTNIEEIEKAGKVDPVNWIRTEERVKIDEDRAAKRKLEEEKEYEHEKDRLAKRQRTIATVGGKRKLSFEHVNKENEQEDDELAKELDFYAKRAEQQNEIIRSNEEMLAKADVELAKKERRMQLMEQELKEKEQKIRQLQELLQQKSHQGEIVEQPRIQEAVQSSSSTSDVTYTMEPLVKHQKSTSSALPGTQFLRSSVLDPNATHQQLPTVPITQVSHIPVQNVPLPNIPVTTGPITQHMPSTVHSVVELIQPEIFIEDPDNTNTDQVILVKKNPETVPEKRSGRTRKVHGILQDENRKYCSECKASYSRSDGLARHKKYDCGKTVRQFVCDKCHKGFYSEVAVREHYYKEHLKTFLYFCPKCNVGFHQNSRRTDHKKNGKCPQKDQPDQYAPRAPLDATLELTFKRREIVQIPKGLMQDTTDNPIAPTSDLPEVSETSQTEDQSGEKSGIAENAEKESNQEVLDSNIPSVEAGNLIGDSTKIDLDGHGSQKDLTLVCASGTVISPELLLANVGSEIKMEINPISIKPEDKEKKEDVIAIELD